MHRQVPFSKLAANFAESDPEQRTRYRGVLFIGGMNTPNSVPNAIDRIADTGIE
jgi:hypothetical protein